MATKQKIFHSFSRPAGRPRDVADEEALHILEKILRSGLLLTSEVINFPPVSLADPKQGRTVTVPEMGLIQTRLSLTAAEPSELLGHTELFGAVTLQFSKENALKMGAIPVVYLPVFDSAGGQMRNMGPELLAAMGLSNKAAMHHYDAESNWDFNINGTHINISDFTLSEHRNHFFGFFYPTENTERGRNYYQQREWRIVGPIAGRYQEDPRQWINGALVFEKPTADEESGLVRQNADFWNRLVPYKGGDFLRKDRAVYIRQVDGMRVQTFIEQIIVPARLYLRARRIVGKSDFRQIPIRIYFPIVFFSMCRKFVEAFARVAQSVFDVFRAKGYR